MDIAGQTEEQGLYDLLVELVETAAEEGIQIESIQVGNEVALLQEQVAECDNELTGEGDE